MAGEWWFPQSVIDSLNNAPPIPTDEQGRPKTLFGRPIVYTDDLPAVPENLFGPINQETKRERQNMNYPTPEQVESADRLQLCKWTRFLPSPGMYAVGRDDFQEIMERQGAIMDSICARLKELGGFTPGISKSLGFAE